LFPALGATCDGEPGVTLNAELVAPPTRADVAVSVYPSPALSRRRSENRATPCVAGTVVVPLSVPPGPEASATVTESPKLVTGAPAASFADTATAGVIA
jgi:hypothetical protein